MAVPIGQQANACEVAVRILSGAASPSKREREFLVGQIRAAGITLRWLEMHETAIRAAVTHSEERA